MRVLHVAPHPDDELIGCPATLMALQDAGHQIHNLAVSLGRPAARDRRRRELAEACRRAGFTLLNTPPLNISHDNDLAAAEDALTGLLCGLLPMYDLLIGPSPHDRHHGHELTGRAMLRAGEAAGRARVWLWGLWADLPFPNVITTFDQKRLSWIRHCLNAHTGEVSRNPYGNAVEGRARANSVLAAERVFGFGAAGLNGRLAEVVCDVRLGSNGRWRTVTPRLLNPHHEPVTPCPDGLDLTGWLTQPSVTDQLTSG